MNSPCLRRLASVYLLSQVVFVCGCETLPPTSSGLRSPAITYHFQSEDFKEIKHNLECALLARNKGDKKSFAEYFNKAKTKAARHLNGTSQYSLDETAVFQFLADRLKDLPCYPEDLDAAQLAELDAQPCVHEASAAIPVQTAHQGSPAASHLRSPAATVPHAAIAPSFYPTQRKPRSDTTPEVRPNTREAWKKPPTGRKGIRPSREIKLGPAQYAEVILDPEKTRVALETILSEWGETSFVVDNALVQHVSYFLKYFSLCNRDGTNRVLERSKKYLPRIREVFSRYGLHQDLAFAVPFVESGFMEEAQSYAGAVGMFQFMAETAKEYGVAVPCAASINGVQEADGRLDWDKTSLAAAQYLSRNRKTFQSVLLALGAYHHGPGTVADVLVEIRDRKSMRTFQSIFSSSKLGPYSREYIPLCLAAAYVQRLANRCINGMVPKLPHQYVNIKKSVSLSNLSAQYKDIQGKNPDLMFADQLYCYASTGGYRLVTELGRPGMKSTNTKARHLLASGR